MGRRVVRTGAYGLLVLTSKDDHFCISGRRARILGNHDGVLLLNVLEALLILVYDHNVVHELNVPGAQGVQDRLCHLPAADNAQLGAHVAVDDVAGARHMGRTT
jgi:hypothetical protein